MMIAQPLLKEENNQMSRFIKSLTSLIIILSLLCGCGATFTPVAAAYSVPYDETISYTYDDIDTLIELIEEQKSNMDAAHQMAEAARQLGYSENHEVILLAQKEYHSASELKDKYQAIYDILMDGWYQKEKEYPTATYIWCYFKELGYSNQVCAGILGNIMAEVGGNTLDIQATISGNGYYGMCQWNKAYSTIWGASLEEQCDYLRDTITYEFDTFGYAYKKGFNYSSFLELTDIKNAALAFAKCYERCGSGSYYIRKENAIIAYNYFVS